MKWTEKQDGSYNVYTLREGRRKMAAIYTERTANGEKPLFGRDKFVGESHMWMVEAETLQECKAATEKEAQKDLQAEAEMKRFFAST